MNKEGNKIKITSFTQLDAWKEGHILVLEIYKVTDNFPKYEMYGLVSQIRISTASITSNISEGFGRESYKDKIRFYLISQGSVRETQNNLIISRDVGYIDDATFRRLASQSVKVHKIINGLIKSSRGRVSS